LLPTSQRAISEPTQRLARPGAVPREPTQVMPTRVLPEPEGKHTDAVAVVAQPSVRSFAVTPRRIGLAAVAAAAIVLGVTIWRLSTGEHDDASASSIAAPEPTTAPSDPTPTVTISAPPPPHTILHMHASAPLASVRVDGRGVALIPGSSDVDLDLGAVDPNTAVTIAAVSTDSRRATIMIAPTASDATIQFPPPAPVGVSRPAPPRTPQPPRAAPLAPSPYP
jgi:hypothetical protein